MIRTTLTLATLAVAAQVPALAQGARVRVVTTSPDVFVEGRPYVVSVEATSVGDKSVEVPAWHLTSAAWDVDSDTLGRRESKGDILLAPGQSIRTSIDLGPAIDDLFEDDPKTFRLRYTGTKDDRKEVIFLARPESGIDFEELPREQLDDYQVVFVTTSGTMWMELWPDVAPNHVRNFLDLCTTGFYDGSPFHRVVPGFMIQGGRAKDGTQAPRKLDQEFSTKRHTQGVLSMARLPGDDNSATSEFFIVHRHSPTLDGKYTAFGQLITGNDAVESVVKTVEVKYGLINDLLRKRVEIDPNSPSVAEAISRPDPPQTILEALVVKASKERPKEPR